MEASGNRARGVRAFTLVELLVVMAVVATMVSLLAPALGRARLLSRRVACLANQHSIGVAVCAYAGDYDERYPLSSHSAGSIAAEGAWLVSLEPYGVIAPARVCPADEFRAAKLTSYATNDHFEPLAPGIDFSPITGKTLPGGRTRALTRMSQIPRPCATVYAVEPDAAGTVDHIHSVAWNRAEQVASAIAVTRHVGSTDFLYADGHGAAAAWKGLAGSFSAATSPFNPETAR